jgi:hypothetical protein
MCAMKEDNGTFACKFAVRPAGREMADAVSRKSKLTAAELTATCKLASSSCSCGPG